MTIQFNITNVNDFPDMALYTLMLDLLQINIMD